jgi:hypothetical protein
LILPGGFQLFNQIREKLPSNGIEPLWAVEGDNSDVVFFFIQDCIVCHLNLLARLWFKGSAFSVQGYFRIGSEVLGSTFTVVRNPQNL